MPLGNTIWKQFNAEVKYKNDRRMMVVGSDETIESLNLESKSLLKSMSLDLVDSLDEGLASLCASQSTWEFCVVDIDCCTRINSLFDVITSLVDFREEAPSIPLIIVSSEFKRHDFGSERLQVADASLRSPLEYRTFIEAVFEARTNNLIWRNRNIA